MSGGDTSGGVGGAGGVGVGVLPRQLPRVTPTQVALLPPRPGDPDLLARVMAPLTWEASKTYTALEWARYGMTRYALEVGLVAIFAAGTSSRDAMHGGYLVLALSFLRLRDAVMVKRDRIFRWLRYYNLAAIGLTLFYQAPLAGTRPLTPRVLRRAAAAALSLHSTLFSSPSRPPMSRPTIYTTTFTRCTGAPPMSDRTNHACVKPLGVKRRRLLSRASSHE